MWLWARRSASDAAKSSTAQPASPREAAMQADVSIASMVAHLDAVGMTGAEDELRRH